MTKTAIISDKQLGDVTLLEPLTRLFAARDGAPVALRVKEAFAPLVQLMPHAQEYRPDMGRLESAWSTSWGSRAGRTAFLTKARTKTLVANQPKHVRWWHNLIYDKTLVEPIGPEYWAHYFWRVGGGGPDFAPPRLNVPDESWAHADLPRGGYVLINPTAAWESKFWTPHAWREVLDSPAFADLPCVMTGGTTEVERCHCEAIANLVRRPLVNLAGKTSMKQYLHALSRAAMVVCVDGSASHLAQAFGVPALTLFGPVFEAKWHWQTPLHRAVCARNFSSVPAPNTDVIPPGAVVEAVREMLASQGCSQRISNGSPG